MGNNGFDCNALRGINPKCSMSQTSDPSMTKVKPKTFSMTQGRPLTQKPKISSTRNANSFKFALFKNPKALAIPDASRQSVFSFQAQHRTQAEGSSQNRLSALFLSDVQKPSKAPGNILQARDVGQGEAQEGRRDASSPLPASPKYEGRAYIHPASHKSPPNRPSSTTSHRGTEFSPEYSRKPDGTASLTSIPGESNDKPSRRQSPALSGAHTSSSPPPSRPSSRSQAVFPRSKNELGFNSIPDTSLKPQKTPPIAKRDVKRAFSDLLETTDMKLFLRSRLRCKHKMSIYLGCAVRPRRISSLCVKNFPLQQLSIAKSDLALTRSNLADAVAEISPLKTSLANVPFL
ncbi:uncharacterized protein LACBIDRAFT_315008 [Laccaria bicolor S238N-H82]|uniref:Predicted protein n=1 Tax=Laccaria bicolor (strain S238N-H82 / ATCC MYA-4686) TaxID=486041 RepID=B0DZJ7_LACBS|nr:uncharacterized protein LACBIDRAFT_315008 [Laccaria bicolor S238N-H82]EDQ99988.1 predicted protein [Laccaria bicolor S238N-H82]|eukprot:XP_001889399.1 predicted protein [Laccaria bicolor S238N-H82]